MTTFHNIIEKFNHGITVPERTVQKTYSTSFSHRIFMWTLFGVIFIPTLLIWTAIFSTLFGFQVVSAHGTSMEPSLCDGDALWVNQKHIDSIGIGDIVTMQNNAESITHRVTNIQSITSNNYLLQTRGDANLYSETWHIGCDEKLAVLVIRVPFAGYLLEFIDTIGGKVLVIELIVIMVILAFQCRKNETLNQKNI